MKKVKLLFILFVLGFTQVYADPVMMITAVGDIKFVDEKGNNVKEVKLGTIGENIEVVDQKLRITHGRDLYGNPTTLIYGSSEEDAPSDISLWISGKKVELRDQAVLTLTTSKDGNSAKFKSGILGSVSIDGQILPASSEFVVNNGELIQQERLLNLPSSSIQTADSVMTSGGFNESTRKMIEDVMEPTALQIIGQVNVTEKYSSIPRALRQGEAIKQGMVIKTGIGGSAIISLMPGSGTWLEPNTEVEIQTLVFNGLGQKKFDSMLMIHEGHVVSALENVDHSIASYKIKTHQGIAEAKGTVFSIISTAGNVIGQVTDGAIQLYGENGTYNFSLQSGFTVTLNGESLNPSSLSLADKARIGQIRNIIREALGLPPMNNDLAAGDRGDITVDGDSILPDDPFDNQDLQLIPQDTTPTS